MKLIIRDERPEEETCEIWLKELDNGRIVVMSRVSISRVSNGRKLIEVEFTKDMTAHHTHSSNFKWK